MCARHPWWVNELWVALISSEGLQSVWGGGEAVLWVVACCCKEGGGGYSVVSHVRRFATPWTAARQASLSLTNSWSLLKLVFIESVMLSIHLILCHPLLLTSIIPTIRVFSSSRFFISGGQSIGASVSASVLPMNIQDWFPLELTGWISLQSKGLSRDFSNITFQKHQFSGT